MSAVTTISAHLLGLSAPAPLRDLPAWLIWRFEHVEGEPKARKVPYYTGGQRRHGVQGRAEDRNQLTTFEAARSAAARRGMDGVGFCPMLEFGVTALDFDDCVVAGQVHEQVMHAVAATYCEYSPSGTGIRAFFAGNLGNLKDHGEPFGFETFSTKGFVTVTGNALDIVSLLGHEDQITPITDAVLELVRARFPRSTSDTPEPASADRLGLTALQIEDALDAIDPDIGHAQWLIVGMALHHELGREGFEIWDVWSKRGIKYPGTATLKQRWQSFGQPGGRPVTARSLLKLVHEHGGHLRVNHSISDFEALADEPSPAEPTSASTPAATTPRFTPISMSAFGSRPASKWWIKGVLPQAELAVLFGASGAGKSFIALQLAAAISRGTDWRARRVRQGRVVYIAAEGAGGFRNRCLAFCQSEGIELGELPIEIIADAPNFLSKDDALDVARAIGRCDVIIVDTWAQTTPGADENSGEDMGLALAHAKGIHRATGALVLIIHHSGKDASKGARGWSGLKAAADAEIEVLRTATGRLMRISKQKDGEDGLEWGFALEQVHIGIDEDGDAITSCVVVESSLPGPQMRALRGHEQVVNDVLAELSEIHDSVGFNELVSMVALRLPAPDEGKRDARKQHAKRSAESFVADQSTPYFLGSDGKVSWV